MPQLASLPEIAPWMLVTLIVFGTLGVAIVQSPHVESNKLMTLTVGLFVVPALCIIIEQLDKIYRALSTLVILLSANA